MEIMKGGVNKVQALTTHLYQEMWKETRGLAM